MRKNRGLKQRQLTSRKVSKTLRGARSGQLKPLRIGAERAVDLLIVKHAAQSYGMRTFDPGEVVCQLQRVLRSAERQSSGTGELRE